MVYLPPIGENSKPINLTPIQSAAATKTEPNGREAPNGCKQTLIRPLWLL